MHGGGVREDLIAAVATPPGQGGIGVVRLSGPGAHEVGEAICRRQLTPRQAAYTSFFAPALEESPTDTPTEVIDEGIALYFAGPASFTGEDVVELQSHGSPVVLQQLLDAACVLGARLAGPGEFSERAFLNGKLDLAQAEAVADLIAATSVTAARAALRSLKGEFSQAVHELTEMLAKLRMLVEACIDFPEEDEDFLAQADVAGQISALRTRLDALLARCRQGQLVNEGIHIALIGPPNAGKSSLLNALSGEETAIVTDVPGTTRDLLKVDLVLAGVPLKLVDTAGLRESADTVEQIGIARARAQAEEADLVIVVLDASALGMDDRRESVLQPDTIIADAVAALSPPEQSRRLVVLNKVDLLESEPPQLTDEPDKHNERVNWVSARQGQGITALKDVIVSAAGRSGAEVGFTARARHIEACQRAGNALDLAAGHLAAGQDTEVIAEELRDAHNALGEIVGTETPDDLLGRIFSEFCIGK